MSRKDKLLARLLKRPRDFTWDELTGLLRSLGYRQLKTGRIGGDHIVKMYGIDDILELLRKEDMI